MLARIIQNFNKTPLRESLNGEFILMWVSVAQGVSMFTERGNLGLILNAVQFVCR